jgi:hypothetical protein
LKKLILLTLTIGLLILGIEGMACATLSVIGSVEYQTGNNTQTFLLIWDDMDNNGESVVWLDYTNYKRSWPNQQQWLDLLNGNGVASVIKKITINEGYTIDWGNNLWRLPDTVDGIFEMSINGSTTGGYNITTSELGHLFYIELKNKGEKSISGTSPESFGLTNKGPFEHIAPFEYWSGTTYMADADQKRAWYFNFSNGLQGVAPKTSDNPNINYPYALALRNAKVTYQKPAVSITPLSRPRDTGSVEKKVMGIRTLPK